MKQFDDRIQLCEGWNGSEDKTHDIDANRPSLLRGLGIGWFFTDEQLIEKSNVMICES